MDAPLVEMRDMSISFGGIRAVDGVSVDLRAGEVVGLLGHNGAGEINPDQMLSGAYKAEGGEILINGSKVAIENPRGCAEPQYRNDLSNARASRQFGCGKQSVLGA